MVATIVGVGLPLDLLPTVVGVFITVLVVGPSSAHDNIQCNHKTAKNPVWLGTDIRIYH